MGFMRDDSRGFIISLDLLIAIIPLTIMLGMVAADMGNILFEIEDTVFRSSIDRTAADTMNTLLQTSGTPPDWEQTGNATVVGLAKYDQSTGKPMEGIISSTKLQSLNDSAVQQIVGNDYGYSMTITEIGTSNIMKSLGTYNTTANEVVRVDKVVLASRLESVSYLLGEIRYTGLSRTYTAPPFQTSTRYNQTYNYWILMLNNTGFTGATVFINGNGITLTNATINTAVQINPNFIRTCSTNPTLFQNNTVTLNGTAGTFGSSMNFFIVQAPKDVTASGINYDTVNPKNCIFILYLWPK